MNWGSRCGDDEALESARHGYACRRRAERLRPARIEIAAREFRVRSRQRLRSREAKPGPDESAGHRRLTPRADRGSDRADASGVLTRCGTADLGAGDSRRGRANLPIRWAIRVSCGQSQGGGRCRGGPPRLEYGALFVSPVGRGGAVNTPPPGVLERTASGSGVRWFSSAWADAMCPVPVSSTDRSRSGIARASAASSRTRAWSSSDPCTCT